MHEGGKDLAAAAAAAADLGFDWPALAGIDVLGWHMPVESVAVEVVQPNDSCGGFTVVERLSLPPSAAGSNAAGLRLDLAALERPLECPYAGLRLRWMATASEISAAS